MAVATHFSVQSANGYCDLQLAEVEACSEQDQRPKRRRHDCRDDLGDDGQLGVVVVLGGDEHANHHVCDQSQTAHSIIFAARDGAPA
jgi:hypothetical protein